MAIGNMSGFRLPSMMEDINIEEVVSRPKRVPTKPKRRKVKSKKKPATSNRKVSLSASDRAKVASKSKSTKPVGFMAKPKPPTKPRSRPGIRVGEDLANRSKKVTPKPTPRTKPKPTPRGRRGIWAGSDGRGDVIRGDGGFDPFQRNVPVRSKSQPKVTQRPSSVKVPTRPKISGEDLMRVSSQTKGRPNIPNVGMSGVIPGANINIQEIIEQATRGQSLDPTKYIREQNEIREKFSDPAQQTQTGSQETTDSYEKSTRWGNMYVPTDESVGKMSTRGGRIFSGTTVYDRYDPETDTYHGSQGGFSGMIPFSVKGSDMPQSFKDLWQKGQKEFTDAKETRKKSKGPVSEGGEQPSSDDASTMETLKEFFEKMKSQQEQQQPQQPQMPQQPKPIPQWDIMGPQPTGPVVAAGSQQPSQFMPRPQMPSQKFGGYGGTAPIVPSMAYAGLGNFPQPPSLIAPFDPDAEPGGPPMPTGPVFT